MEMELEMRQLTKTQELQLLVEELYEKGDCERAAMLEELLANQHRMTMQTPVGELIVEKSEVIGENEDETYREFYVELKLPNEEIISLLCLEMSNEMAGDFIVGHYSPESEAIIEKDFVSLKTQLRNFLIDALYDALTERFADENPWDTIESICDRFLEKPGAYHQVCTRNLDELSREIVSEMRP